MQMLRFAKTLEGPPLPVRLQITACLRCSASSSSVLIQARFDKTEARLFYFNSRIFINLQ